MRAIYGSASQFLPENFQKESYNVVIKMIKDGVTQKVFWTVQHQEMMYFFDLYDASKSIALQMIYMYNAPEAGCISLQNYIAQQLWHAFCANLVSQWKVSGTAGKRVISGKDGKPRNGDCDFRGQ